jgi:hypothetical protein
MPDGSIICLLRTENGVRVGSAPSYICRSADNGKTWDEPRFSAVSAYGPMRKGFRRRPSWRQRFGR